MTRTHQETSEPGNSQSKLEAINRAILESALDCIITMDAAGIVREFNPAAERVFGFKRAEAVGRELAELIIPSRLRERHRQGLERYLKIREGPVIGRRIEINALRRDGSEILVELAITPFEIEGSPFFTAYLRDITERKRNETARHRLAAIIESSDDSIISTDLGAIVTSWNVGAQRLFGYAAEEVIGQSVTILIPPDRPNEEPHILERIRRGERVEYYETMRLRKNGKLIHVSLSVSPIKDEQGRVVGASKIARDITEQVRSDRRRLAQYTVASLLAGSWTLEEASSPILQTLTSIGEWIFAALWIYDDATGRLRCRSCWHAEAEPLEKFAELSRVTEFQKGKGLPGRVWESKEPAWIHNVVIDPNFPRARGAEVAGLHGGFAFPLFAGRTLNGVIELFGYEKAQPDDDLLKLVEALGSQIGLFIERRRVEQELQSQKENAEAASAAKDRFLAMLSHELRTPLTPVLIWAGGMMKEPGLSPEMQQGLRMVSRNVELEARLIDDMLDLTRITRGKLKLQLGRADVHDLLQHALDIVRSEMEDRHLQFSFAFDASAHQLVVDAPRLQQVFWNIFRNAYKYTPDNGTISVRTHNLQPDRITIEIADTGAGLAPQFLEKIFGTFEQVDSMREGLGLGLAISKAIIEMHGGAIRAQSEGLGKGATFVIELPLGRLA